MSTFQPTYSAWTPAAAGFQVTEEYLGRHRRAEAPRRFAFLRMFTVGMFTGEMFYVGRHRKH